jgi:glyoxylase-like metal-dependent hydrolase (beta-lactamase superfamily II)
MEVRVTRMIRPDVSTRDNWTEPGTFEVEPGIYRIPLPLPNDGLRAVNVYALARGDDLMLIDSGWAIADARGVLDKGLAVLGCSAGDVRRILVTHVHRDHYTQAVYLRREFGTRVSLGAGERESLDVSIDPDRAPMQNQLRYLRQLGAGDLADRMAKLQGPRDPHKTGWERPDDWLRDGQAIAHGGRTLEVVSTPGHTRGHVVFHDTGGQVLFAGDHVLPAITPSIGFEPVLSDDPLGAFLGSLTMMRSRPDARLLPAHGPVTGSTHARVDALIAHHGTRLDETEAAIRGGAQTAPEAAAVLRWTRRGRELADLDPFNQMLAISETAAHLQLLAAQGRVTRHEADGLRYYLPA